MFKWLPIFQLTVEPSILTAWMSFEGLSIYFFNKSALFSIATTMGKPLKIDEATANFTRPSIARVCIKVDMLKPLLNGFGLGLDLFLFFCRLFYMKMYLHIVLIAQNWVIQHLNVARTLWETMFCKGKSQLRTLF